jgi:hypothetical protein
MLPTAKWHHKHFVDHFARFSARPAESAVFAKNRGPVFGLGKPFPGRNLPS